MIRITIVISQLWGGGAERVASTLANGWAEQGHGVSILTFQPGGARTYPLHASVRVRDLDLTRESRNLFDGLLQNIRRLWVLRRAIRESQPDIVISFLDRVNVLTVLAGRGLGKPVVISERTSPRRGIIRRWSNIRALVYPLADMLVCQTNAALAGFQALTKARGIVIPNPISSPYGFKRPAKQMTTPFTGTVIAMGRLVPEKGFDLLLQAFARIAGVHPQWSLTIIGKGPLQAKLEEQSKALGLDGRLCFAGELADPFSALGAADLFVLSSRFEGFPNALVEAMACGLPVLSFDCPDGPREIIRDGIDGVLVPAENVAALAATLDRLMGDPEERKRIAAQAAEITARFSREHVLALWQDLFARLLASESISNPKGTGVGVS